MSRIFIMALEPIETRYTAQWFDGIPKILRKEIAKRKIDIEVYNIGGIQSNTKTTDGAFLNFAATNIWKNTQINTMVENFATGKVTAGDKILFTDAWHPGILQIKYMSELLDIPIEIHSMWHAGSYDQQDFLGRKIKDKTWSFNAERAFAHASDHNYFASRYHINLFKDSLLMNGGPFKTVRAGQPHNELIKILKPYANIPKKRQIVFPHRIAVEKQVNIFKDLAKSMPDVNFVICQEKNLTKNEYHQILAESSISFSANLQETLGISSCIEAPLTNTVPFVPRRLSYVEIFAGYNDFVYDSICTESWDKYLNHKDQLIARLRYMLDNYELYLPLLKQYRKEVLPKYANADEMIERLLT